MDKITTNNLLKGVDGIYEVSQLDDYLKNSSNGSTESVLSSRTAVKVLLGRRDAASLAKYLTKQHQTCTITLVQPMYHEAARISPRTKRNPHGEDALRQKLDFLHTLHESYPCIATRLLVVDDGCDGEGDPALRSGLVAKRIMRSWVDTHPHSQVRTEVLFLADAITSNSRLTPPNLRAVQDSHKGGSVLYGLAYAVEEWPTATNRHVLVDSDADLSVHPEQLPSVVWQLIKNEALVAAGSRREPSSVTYISGQHHNNGAALFIETWRRLLPTLAAQRVSDTDRGFKAIDASLVPTLMRKARELRFAYQIEMLLLAASQRKNAICMVPVAFIDSSTLSTREHLSFNPKFAQSQAALAIAKRHNERYDPAVAALLEDLKAAPDGDRRWTSAAKAGVCLDKLIAMHSSLG